MLSKSQLRCGPSVRVATWLRIGRKRDTDEEPLSAHSRVRSEQQQLAEGSGHQRAATQTFEPISRPLSSNRVATRGCLAGRLLSARPVAGAVDPLPPFRFAGSSRSDFGSGSSTFRFTGAKPGSVAPPVDRPVQAVVGPHFGHGREIDPVATFCSSSIFTDICAGLPAAPELPVLPGAPAAPD